MNLKSIELKTTMGTLKGLDLDGVYCFKGIPYADNLTGLNRWLPPQPVKPWNGTLDTTDFGEICPQNIALPPLWIMPKKGKILLEPMVELANKTQGPNCLNLNLWTPEIKPNKKLPVMLFIHGGGLSMGSSTEDVFDGTETAKKGIIFISINYRLGTMGFLAGDGLFDGDTLKGNRGFMDAIEALKWVKQNISDFGGDKNNVTVVGQSGGATSLWSILASPASEGLFHRAIFQSGPINMVPIDDQLKLTEVVLKKLKIKKGDTKALANIPTDKIKGSIMQGALTAPGKDFGEMSQTKLPTTGAYGTDYLPLDILDALKAGHNKHVDILVGSNLNDGRASSIGIPFPRFIGIKMMNSYINGMIGKTKKERKEKVKHYREIMKGTSEADVQEQIQTDALYRMRGIKAAEIHSKHKESNTYMYQFNWKSPALGGVFGALHGIELGFVFNNLKALQSLIGDPVEPQPLADAMSDAWVSFVKNGKPESSSLPSWNQYNTDTRETMFFDRECTIENDPDSELRKLWID